MMTMDGDTRSEVAYQRLSSPIVDASENENTQSSSELHSQRTEELALSAANLQCDINNQPHQPESRTQQLISRCSAPIQSSGYQQEHGSQRQYSPTYVPYENLSRLQGTDPLRWDTTVIDKVLYLFTPLLLLKCGLILLFVISPLEPPHLSIDCWLPAEFSGAWINYGNQYCLSKVKEGRVYQPLSETIPDHGQRNSYIGPGLFDQSIYPNPPVAVVLFVMAMLSVMPFVAWRCIGRVDAVDLIIRDSRKSKTWRSGLDIEPRCLQRTDMFQCMGLVGSKLLAAGICLMMLIMTSVVTEQGRQYTLKNEEYATPNTEVVLCDFKIRRLGANLHKYTVQCVVSSNRDNVSAVWRLLDVSHIIMPLLAAVVVLIVLVLITQIANALLITATLYKSHQRSFRQLIIQRYSEEEDQQVRNIMDDIIGTYGTFATVMAVRCGETQRITEIYKTIAAKAKVELEKQD